MSAAEEGRAIMDRLGISCEIGAATPYQDGEWIAFERVYTFKRDGRDEAFPYRMGVGNIPWKSVKPRPGEEGDWSLIDALRSHVKLKPEFHADAAKLAAKWAQRMEIKADPAEVLHALADDGSALDVAFEEWAPNYGYDPDSIKALRTWEACCDTGRRLLHLMGRSDMETLAALEF